MHNGDKPSLCDMSYDEYGNILRKKNSKYRKVNAAIYRSERRNPDAGESSFLGQIANKLIYRV